LHQLQIQGLQQILMPPLELSADDLKTSLQGSQVKDSKRFLKS